MQQRIATACAAWLCLAATAPAHSDTPPLERAADVVFIRAERAVQAADRGSFVLDGGLRLAGERWVITADHAVVSGRLQDPDRIEVSGAPARMTLQRETRMTPLRASSQHLVFEPRAELVRLRGAATVDDGEQSISSEAIRYLLNDDTFAAGSDDGGRVRVVTRPRAGR